jgi:hypothetical protein
MTPQVGRRGDTIRLDCSGEIVAGHGITPRQIDIFLAGGLINWRRRSVTD